MRIIYNDDTRVRAVFTVRVEQTTCSSLRRARRAAVTVNLWAPPPIFYDRRVAADNFSALRRCHVSVFNYFGVFFMLCLISLSIK